MMGGTIDVETEKGKGTEFIIGVSLPITEAEEENSVQEPETVSFKGTRALLVEDNEINREIAQMLSGSDVTEAAIQNAKQLLRL